MNVTEFMALFPEFREPSWNAWREILESINPDTKELYAVAGRGSGKSRICALLGTCAATRTYKRAPGERIYVGIFAPDRRQAKVTHAYAAGLLHCVPELEALITRELRESIELSTGVTLEIITASAAAPRGRSYALCIVEEAAFLRSDDVANPDRELLRALAPALARVPGSLLAVVSTPYARRGIVYDASQRAKKGLDDAEGPWRDIYTSHEITLHGTPHVLYVQAPTLALNPTFDAAAVERALEEDPAGARAEYLAEFRADVESFIRLEAVAGCTVPDRLELPPVEGVTYTGFVDFAGGSGQDSATLAIAHAEDRDGQRVAVLDAVRETRPPFSPEQVAADFAAQLKRYRLTTATADRYAAEFATEAMSRHGITLKPSKKPKSDIYRELLPALNSGNVELLDVPKLHAQIVGLERRVARGGRDSIDHAPGGHDDVANAVAGALVSVAQPRVNPWTDWLDWEGEESRPTRDEFVRAGPAFEHDWAQRIAAARRNQR